MQDHEKRVWNAAVAQKILELMEQRTGTLRRLIPEDTELAIRWADNVVLSLREKLEITNTLHQDQALESERFSTNPTLCDCGNVAARTVDVAALAYNATHKTLFDKGWTPTARIVRVHFCDTCMKQLAAGEIGDQDAKEAALRTIGGWEMRDVYSPCWHYSRGRPTSSGDCEGDGHYLCDECSNHFIDYLDDTDA